MAILARPTTKVIFIKCIACIFCIACIKCITQVEHSQTDKKKNSALPHSGRWRFSNPLRLSHFYAILQKSSEDQRMVTIKAIRSRGGEIEWNYDSPQQGASRLWRELVATGRAPDTGESLIRAYYFGMKNKPGDGPDKVWMV